MSCPETRKVDLHFEERISPAEERAMREHLPTCDACTKRYERHLVLEQLDPAARGPGPRIAAGLGLGETRAPSSGVVRFLARPGVIAAVAAAACIAFLVHRLPSTSDPSGFSARGGPATDAADSAELTVYRGSPLADGSAVRAGASIRRGDELAFAYRNPGGKRYLMIYGVDAHRRVYWYYPAWTDPSENPSSIAIEPTNAPRPLPDAVKHGLEGDVLDIHAVFTDAPLDVRTVERQVAEGKAPGATSQSLRFRLEP